MYCIAPLNQSPDAHDDVSLLSSLTFRLEWYVALFLRLSWIDPAYLDGFDSEVPQEKPWMAAHQKLSPEAYYAVPN
jgi:hypothetical protein